MQGANRLCCILMVGISLLHIGDGYLSFTPQKMRQKFITLDKELVVDAMAKIDEIENLKLKESRSTAYRQGELAYHARRKWALMLRIYFKCVSTVNTMNVSQVIQDMTRLQRMNMDIYHATENMMQLEEEELEPPNADWRRSSGGARASRSDMKRYLSAADAAVRAQMRKRSEQLRNMYLRTKPAPVFDFQEELEFLEKNVSEVILPKKYTEKSIAKDIDHDPELVWPFIYY